MGRVKTGNSKKRFMREHDCRFCLYYGTCSHKECMFDGSGSPDAGECGKDGVTDAAERGAVTDAI